jgi:hypothetical protein
MIFTERILRPVVKFAVHKEEVNRATLALSEMLRQEFDEVMLRTLAGKENERIFLGDGVEIDTATNEIELGEKLAVCIMLKVRYPAHARKTKGVYAILPRRKDDIEPKRFKSTAIHLEGPAINVHEFFKPDPRRRLMFSFPRNKTISVACDPASPMPGWFASARHESSIRV